MDNGADSFRRYLNGDDDAFIEIMDMYRMGLIFFINRFVGDYHAAEDISMECFVYLLVHKHRYNFSVSLKTYLYMIGRSKALTYIKKRKRMNLNSLDELAATPDDLPSPEEFVLCSEEKRQIERCISSLTNDMQSAVHLVYFEGLTYAEAVKVMKTSEKRMDNILYNARKKLKGQLDPMIRERSKAT